MVHLARKHDGQSVVRADDIAESEAIPSSFLAQILHGLHLFMALVVAPPYGLIRFVFLRNISMCY